MKLVKKNIYCNLITDNSELLKILHKKYTFKIPNAMYAMKHTRGWDGTKSFFSKKGRFGTGLLPSIEADLKKVEANYTLEEPKCGATKIPEVNLKPMSDVELRDYQSEALEAIEANNYRGVIKAPTGAGKTIILADVVNSFKDEIGVVFFTKKQILFQTYESLQKLGIDCGIVCGEANDIKPITLCTIQSIDKILGTHVKHSKFLIFDEIHEFGKGKLSVSCLKSFPNAPIRLGFSATPPSEDTHRYAVESFLGPIIYDIEATKLIEDGFLAKPSIKILPATPPTNYTPDSQTDYISTYDDFIINNDNRNNQIAEIVKNVKKGKVLILTKNLEHSHLLHELIPNSLQLEGKHSQAQREKTIKEFVNDTETSVLIGTVILQTGVDIPEITHFINARGMKSEIATIQAIGRALRVTKSKTEAIIFDFYDDTIYLSKHSKARIKHYKAKGFDVTIYEK